jgi:hypothetical protein
MARPDKLIIFLGRTFRGHNHADLHVRVDLGYLGIKADYRGEQMAIPTRKPRKSQKPPPTIER